MRLTTLKRRSDFQRVRAGCKWAAPAFILQGLARGGGDEAGEPRFGFVIAGKTIGGGGPEEPKRAGAVLRNRAKRRLREAVRLSAALHARPGFDYVIIGRRDALHQSFADLLEDMRRAFAKVHHPRPAKGTGAKPRPGQEQAAGASQRDMKRT